MCGCLIFWLVLAAPVPGRCSAAERGKIPSCFRWCLTSFSGGTVSLVAVKSHPGTLCEMERKEAEVCPVHHLEGGASLGAQRWAWPGVVTLHREPMWTSYSSTETLSPISFVSHSFPKSSSLWSFSWLVWHFPSSHKRRWVPLFSKGKEILLCVISFPYGKTQENEGGADGCDLPRKRARPNEEIRGWESHPYQAS